MGVISDVLTNVIANFVFWIGLGLIVAFLVRIAQRRFRRFFGLTSNPNLAACLSNLWSNEVSARPRGYAVSLHELRASEAITRLFGSASFRLPDVVRGLVDAIYLGDKSYTFRISVSPAATDRLHDFEDLEGNLVVVGGASKNRIRQLYVEENLVGMRLSEESPGAGVHQLPPGERFAEVLAGADSGRRIISASLEVAIVEKARDDTRGTTVFFCLGRRGDTTWAATEYLARNWRSLRREFGDAPFAVCLGFRDPEYSYEYREPARLFSLRR